MSLDKIPPVDLSAITRESWRLWLEHFQHFLSATSVANDGKRRSALLFAIGREAFSRYNALPREAQGETFAATVTALETVLLPRKSTIFARHKFSSLCQQPTQSIDGFAAQLRSMSVDCACPISEDQYIRDQFIRGIVNERTKQRLLEETDDLTFQHALVIAKSFESAASESHQLQSSDKRSEDVQAVKAKPQKYRQWASTKSDRRSHQQSRTCGNCGRTYEGKHECPANNVECFHCHKRGHFAKYCRSRVVKSLSSRQSDSPKSNSESDEFAFMTVSSNATPPTDNKQWTLTLNVNGKKVLFYVDTQASVSILPAGILPSNALRRSDTSIRAYMSKDPLPCDGLAHWFVRYRNRKTRANFYVIPGATHALLGQPEIEALRLLSFVHSVDGSNPDIVSRYADIFTGVGCVDTEVKIDIRPDATPTAQPCRRLPIALRKPVELELERLTKAGIVEPVKETCDWLSPIVVARKKGGAIRLCGDYRVLNKAMCRERHLMPSPEELFANMQGSTVFSELDARSGYHQLPLSLDSRRLTSFVTHKGVYRYRRLPFGIASASEIFQRVMSEKFSDLPGVEVFVDNIIIHGRDQADHDTKLEAAINRCRKIKLSLNLEKCKFSQSSIRILGHQLSAAGITPDPDKVAAIQDMAKPADVKGVRRLLGSVQYMAKFLPELSEVSKPLRNLLVGNNEFVWSSDCDESFAKLKSLLVSSRVLAYYDVEAETYVTSDASSHGLGACLLQRQTDGELHPVMYASRALAPAEYNYSQLEKETLAIVFAITRFRQFISGLSFTVITDHKPLEYIFGKPLEQSPPRIQRWLLALMSFTFTVRYEPGSSLTLNIPDMLSRAPISGESSPEETRNLTESVNMLTNIAVISSDKLAEATEADPVLRSVLNHITSSDTWSPTEKEQPFYSVRSELTVTTVPEGRILFFEARIVIPQSLRSRVLELAHEGHPGIVKMKEYVRLSSWWPHQTTDVEYFAKHCPQCSAVADLPRPEPLQIERSGAPWERVGIDIVFIENCTLLSVIDYCTRYPQVIELRSSTSTAIICELSRIFARFGIPWEVISDNGRQFTSAEVTAFFNRLNTRHVRASPYFPQSNGRVERLHRVLKRMMKATLYKLPDRPFNARLCTVLLQLRSMPHTTTGQSPAMLMFGRPTRDKMPTLKVSSERSLHEKRKQLQMKEYHDKRHGAKMLPDIPVASEARIKHPLTDDTPNESYVVTGQQVYTTPVLSGPRVLLWYQYSYRGVSFSEHLTDDVLCTEWKKPAEPQQLRGCPWRGKSPAVYKQQKTYWCSQPQWLILNQPFNHPAG